MPAPSLSATHPASRFSLTLRSVWGILKFPHLWQEDRCLT